MATQRQHEFVRRSELERWLKEHRHQDRRRRHRSLRAGAARRRAAGRGVELLMRLHEPRQRRTSTRPFKLSPETVNTKVRGVMHMMMTMPEYQLALTARNAIDAKDCPAADAAGRLRRITTMKLSRREMLRVGLAGSASSASAGPCRRSLSQVRLRRTGRRLEASATTTSSSSCSSPAATTGSTPSSPSRERRLPESPPRHRHQGPALQARRSRSRSTPA